MSCRAQSTVPVRRRVVRLAAGESIWMTYDRMPRRFRFALANTALLDSATALGRVNTKARDQSGDRGVMWLCRTSPSSVACCVKANHWPTCSPVECVLRCRGGVPWANLRDTAWHIVCERGEPLGVVTLSVGVLGAQSALLTTTYQEWPGSLQWNLKLDYPIFKVRTTRSRRSQLPRLHGVLRGSRGACLAPSRKPLPCRISISRGMYELLPNSVGDSLLIAAWMLWVVGRSSFESRTDHCTWTRTVTTEF